MGSNGRVQNNVPHSYDACFGSALIKPQFFKHLRYYTPQRSECVQPGQFRIGKIEPVPILQHLPVCLELLLAAVMGWRFGLHRDAGGG